MHSPPFRQFPRHMTRHDGEWRNVLEVWPWTLAVVDRFAPDYCTTLHDLYLTNVKFPFLLSVTWACLLVDSAIATRLALTYLFVLSPT